MSRPSSWVLAVLVAAAAPWPGSAAEIYFEQTTVTSAAGQTGQGVLSRVWYAGPKMRLEAGGAAAAGPALILRLDQGTAWRLDPASKTALKLDLARLRAQTQADAALAGELMGAGEPDSVRTARLPVKVVAGRRCRGWRLRAGSAVLDVYTSTEVPVGVEAFADFLEWSGASDAMAGLLAEMRKLPGFPLETRSQVNVLGEVHETVSTVTRLKVGPLAAALFEPPAGYRRRAEPAEPR